MTDGRYAGAEGEDQRQHRCESAGEPRSLRSPNRVTRSGALERWLAQASRRERLARLEEETAAYYDSLTEAERREDAALASIV
jgi:hypothetical protein